MRSRSGYDEWAALVGDDRWSYDGLLPYWKKAETYPTPGLEDHHGYDGPIHPSLSNRGYPLKEPMKQALLEAGVPYNDDPNGGNAFGFGPLVESYSPYPDKKRSYAANSYQLDDVNIMVDSAVARITIEGQVASGVQLANGHMITAKREVILSAGAINTPKLLMLSGVGNKTELEALGLASTIDLPDVGLNLWDHPSAILYWKLRNPQDDLAMGSVGFNSNPKFFEGTQCDWLMVHDAPDVVKGNSRRRDELEITFNYISIPFPSYPEAPAVDGSHIATPFAVMSSTSRGTVKLASSDSSALPVVDNNWLATEYDQAVLRSAARLTHKIMSTPAAQKFIVGETPPKAYKPISLATTDAELDERFREGLFNFSHPGGTAAMGKVVDTDCRVMGLKNLRVVDASIMPVSIGAHLQAGLYGVAERAAAMIVDSDRQA